MTCNSTNSKTRQIRSVSMPIGSHPTTRGLEEELNNLKSFESTSTTYTSSTICNGLSRLENLYNCIDDLLNLPSTQQIVSQCRQEKWVDELLDGSVRLLDTCGNTMDLVTQLKEHIGDVRSCLRRRKGDSSIVSSIAKFTLYRKKMKKDTKKVIVSLKKMYQEIVKSQNLDLDHHVSAVIEVLKEANVMNISIFQSLLVFLSVSDLKSHSAKWSSVSKLMRKGKVACEGQFDNANELQRVDAALSSITKYGAGETEKMHLAQKSLEALECRVEEIQVRLECVFRRLIRTRATFLNIISQ